MARGGANTIAAKATIAQAQAAEEAEARRVPRLMVQAPCNALVQQADLTAALGQVLRGLTPQAAARAAAFLRARGWTRL